MKKIQHKKSVKKWVLLLMMPIVALMLVALAQVVVRFVFTSSGDSTSTIEVVVSILSLIIGVVGIMVLLLTPLWLVMIVRDLKGHLRSKTVAVVLAVFFGLFSWIYTFEKNYKKFWINLGLSIVSLGCWSLVAWVWAIIDNASKPKKFYVKYNQSLRIK